MVVLTGVAAALADRCDIDGPSRKDCGFEGIDQSGCEAKGCCWKPAADSSTPWCFDGTGPGPAPAPAQCSLKYTSTEAPFSSAEVDKVREYFLANINIDGSGAVVAAPDHNTGPGGDYYFHWERDGALSMGALLKTAGKLGDVDSLMQQYVKWVDKVQHQADPHGIDIRTEPKYTIPDGKPFSGSWCRPQNDGPALRGKTLAEYALALAAAGRKAEIASQGLWTGDASIKNGGLVKHDLDWAAENWQSNGCDLWEEIQSSDFFWNRYTARAGLTVGAELATKLGDAASAAKYATAAKAIEGTLMAHFDGSFVFEAEQRKKDAAVIEAFNDGSLQDEWFAPLSKEVLGTVVALNDLFCGMFAINRVDGAAGIPGILYGRYEGDNYDGGNPWVLLSATLAELIYRQAAAAAAASAVDASTYDLLQAAYDLDSGLKGKDLGDALRSVGDGVMLRIKHHVVGSGLHMNEQIGREDGHLTSAKDLTWNYANVLKALYQRDRYEALHSPAHAKTTAILV